MRVLILGGTTEARTLAGRLTGLGHEVVTSLAGRTGTTNAIAGTVRVGGFGGAEALAAYLTGTRIDYLVDATHPFAKQISANAVRAAQVSGISLLRCTRPPWRPAPGTDWQIFATLDAAAARLPAGACVLLTTGQGGLDPFLARTDCRFVVRLIQPPGTPLPAHGDLVLERPPYAVGDEAELMRSRGVTHLVTKNAGGVQTAAKLAAAQQLGVQVMMIERPELAPAPEVFSVDEAVKRLQAFAS